MKRYAAVVSVLLCIAAAPVLRVEAKPIVLYVSTAGNDQWSGGGPSPSRTDGPFATLEAARDRLDALAKQGKLPTDGAIVEVRGGVYRRLRPFTLGAADNVGPVVYQSYRGEEVILSGGREVTGWTPLTDTSILNRLDPEVREHVVRIDLRAQGITDYGDLSARGFGRPESLAPLELFSNDKPMTLSRWPNTGEWATVADVPAGTTDRFAYTGDRPSRWINDPDVWVHGYFGFDWADTYQAVARIDPVNHLIVTADPVPPFGYVNDHRWYALNILEELDEPGEYYLDRSSGVLYFWPPAAGERSSVSLAGQLMTLSGVSRVTVRGLTFEECRGTAITVTGGQGDLIENCSIRNIGGTGITMDQGHDNGVKGCEISQTGEGGVDLTAGDRATLAPGNCFVTDCRIHDYDRWCRTYHPGVGLYGVGNTLAHNLIYNAPHQAVQFGGNDNVIEYNEVHHVCTETGDAGAFYIGRDWSMRGNIVRYNYFHDIGGATGLVGYHDEMSVYLDDMTCGTTVYGNLFVRARHAIQLGGGRDDIIENNIFVDCSPAVSVDARGLTWAAKYIVPGGGWTIQERLAAIHYDQPPYSTRYPDLVTMVQNNPGQPEGDVLSDNIVVNCPNWLDEDKLVGDGLLMQNNLTDKDPLFVNPAKDNYNLKSNSPAIKMGIKPLPLNLIGPRN